jgi:cell division protein FtsI (penicillin-binding protein 3)
MRLYILAGFFALVWLGLWGRAYYIQVLSGNELAARANDQYWVKRSAYGERGEIYDREGRLLAKSVLVRSVFARPREVANADYAAEVLARVLERDRGSIREKLSQDRNFVWIARKVGDATAQKIQSSYVQGIYLTEEKRRFYPQGHLAGQLLGFVGVDNQGLEGLELYFDDRLSGEKQIYSVQRDASGRLLFAPGQLRRDLAGGDVTLTIDSRIQYAAEEALAQAVSNNGGRHGMCLVLDADTGSVRAWANYPFFNPNNFRQAAPVDWRNRVALDEFEPGSTMKPFLIASALQEGICRPDSIFFCEQGEWSYHGHTFKDSHAYGWLGVRRIIRYSSNIGAGKIGLELGPEKYHGYLRRLGLGRETGLPLPGENTGTLRQGGSWTDIDMIAASFGQGFSLNTLQLARAYLCLASGGRGVPLRLVREPHRSHGEPERIYSRQTAKEVLAMLRDVVEEDGTGTKARITGLQVGGKTGTAQKASPKGGYGDSYVASFVGLFPALDPEYLAVMVVDEPERSHYGGVVAAPAVREIGISLVSTADDLQALWMDESGSSGQAPVASRPEFTGESRQVAESGLDPGSGDVPDLRGQSLRSALEFLARKGIVPRVRGRGGLVAKQSPRPGSEWDEKGDRRWVLWLSRSIGDS